MEDLAFDRYAARVLLQLLAPDSPRHLPPHVLAMMHPPSRTVRGSTGRAVAGLDDDDADGRADGGDAKGQVRPFSELSDKPCL